VKQGAALPTEIRITLIPRPHVDTHNAANIPASLYRCAFEDGVKPNFRQAKQPRRGSISSLHRFVGWSEDACFGAQ
jgi:hypothetical protein